MPQKLRAASASLRTFSISFSRDFLSLAASEVTSASSNRKTTRKGLRRIKASADSTSENQVWSVFRLTRRADRRLCRRRDEDARQVSSSRRGGFPPVRQRRLGRSGMGHGARQQRQCLLHRPPARLESGAFGEEDHRGPQPPHP